MKRIRFTLIGLFLLIISILSTGCSIFQEKRERPTQYITKTEYIYLPVPAELKIRCRGDLRLADGAISEDLISIAVERSSRLLECKERQDKLINYLDNQGAYINDWYSQVVQ